MYNLRHTFLSRKALAMLVSALLLGLPLMATAADGQPMPDIAGLSGDYQARYEAQWNASGFMQRLVNLLTSPEWGGSCAELKPMVEALQRSGKLNFTGCQEAFTIDQNLVHYTVATHYAGLTPEQFKGQLFALPNRPLASAQYAGDEALLYIGLNNVPQAALLAFHEIASHPEMLKEGPFADLLEGALDEMGAGDFNLEDLPQIETMIDGFGVENQVNQMLTGELGLAVYGADWGKLMEGHDFQPTDISAAVFLGLKDGAAASAMLSAYGSDIGLSAGPTANGWTSYSINDQPGISISVGPNMLIASLGKNAMPPMTGTPTADCQYLIKLNLNRLVHEVLEPAIGPELEREFNLDELAGEAAAQGALTPQQLDVAWRYLLDIDRTGSNLGHVVLTGRYADGYQADVSMRPDVFMYLLYNIGRIAGTGMLQEHLTEHGDHHDGGEPEMGHDGSSGDAPPMM